MKNSMVNRSTFVQGLRIVSTAILLDGFLKKFAPMIGAFLSIRAPVMGTFLENLTLAENKKKR